MDKELKLKFVEALNRLEGKEYLASVIAFGAAPTVCGKKPSSLLAFNSGGKNLLALWRQYGKDVSDSFNVKCFILKEQQGSITVLLYREKMLDACIKAKHNKSFLQRMGYNDSDTLEQKLYQLKKRFEDMCPHEVGIFLGIPLEDVEGFIKHKGKACLMCRYWKVYQNVRRAELLFDLYDKARSNMAYEVVQAI